MTDHRKKEAEEIPIRFERGAKNAEQTADAADDDSAESTGATDERDSVAERIGKLEAEKNDLTQTLMRRQADFENFRKRVEKERHEEHRRGAGKVMESLLPVLDGFDLALKSQSVGASDDVRKGVELIYRQLWDALAKQGLERIDAVGKPFDPHYHHAIGQVETDEVPDGSVVEVLQEGFLFHGKVLRPCAVRVAVNSGEGDDGKSPAARHHAN